MAQARTLVGPGVLQGLRAQAKRSGGVDHVVEQDAGLAGDVADDVEDLGDVGGRAALVDDRQRGVQPPGEMLGPADAAGVGRDDGDVFQAEALDIFDHDRNAVEIIHRDGEKALDLGRMKIHRQNPVGPGRFQEIGHRAGP